MLIMGPLGSIFMISGWFPAWIFLHDLQLPHGPTVEFRLLDRLSATGLIFPEPGVSSALFSAQLHAMANTRAVACFPTPGIPVKSRA
jgi:hypothetical protein